MFVRWLGVLAVLGGAAAMYVDEQGSRDWMREHLGQVTRASFRKREMFGATVSGAVFKLQNARTGKVQWRHVLPGQEAACTLLLPYAASQPVSYCDFSPYRFDELAGWLTSPLAPEPQDATQCYQAYG